MIYDVSTLIDIRTPVLDKYLIDFYGGEKKFRRINLKASKIEYNFSLENIYHELKVYIPKKDFNLYNDVNGAPYLSYNNNIKLFKYDRINLIISVKNTITKIRYDLDTYDFEIRDFKIEGDFLIIYANDDLIQLERFPRVKLSKPSGVTFKDLFFKDFIIPKDSNFWDQYLNFNAIGVEDPDIKILGYYHPNIWDANIGQLDIVDPMTPIDILKKLKDSFPLLYFYLRNNSNKKYISKNGDYFMTSGTMNFNVGWKYWNQTQIQPEYKKGNVNPIKTYKIKYPFTNIDAENKNNYLPLIENNLSFNSNDKTYTLVKGTFQTKYLTDLNVEQTKTYTIYYGAKGYSNELPKGVFSNIININIKDNIPYESTNPLKVTAKTIVKAAYDNIPSRGWSGSVTLFGSPTIRVGDQIIIENDSELKTTNKYFVKSVNLTVSSSGYFKTLEIENTTQ